MLSRDDVVMICAELGGALLRIGERLSAPRIVAEPATIAEVRREVAKGPGPVIAQPAPEPAAAPAAAPRPVPATLQRKAAVAGPVDRPEGRPRDWKARRYQQEVEQALRRIGRGSRSRIWKEVPLIPMTALENALRALRDLGRAQLEGDRKYAVWRWVGAADPEAQAKKASDIEAFIAEKGVTKCPPAGSGPLPHFLPGGPKRPPRILQPGERP